ncbi:MAG: substrate-binding domain-containing protein [Bacteroidetes bacterium]|nr:substrate-binding domain-containing protein [Bacteroidota bacterium]MBS1982444.1 substrate-binding domain-containing protein [Bacteroidota bacterium]
MKRILFTLALCAGLFSCTEKDKKGLPLDTPTSGTIKIAVDESLKPLIQAEVEGFEGIYPLAHFQPNYTSEQQAISDLLKDSVRLAIVTRKLYSTERSKLDSLKIQGAEIVMAKEGIALITNKQNPDSLLTWKQIEEIFTGSAKTWNQLFPSSSLGDMQVIFDHPQSGIIRYLTDTLKINNLPPYCFAVSTNEAVIDRVSKTKNAIGLIGLSWISDNDDPKANSFLSSIKVVSIKTDDDYLKPYKAYIFMKKYPLSREVIIISREARSGLGSGFIAYAVSDKGQLIVLKAGLVPAKAPIRLVEVQRKPLEKITTNQ